MNSKQVVLITGSSTGFGRLFAETLARKGHTVFPRDDGVTPQAAMPRNASENPCGGGKKDSLPIHVLELDVTDDAFGRGGPWDCRRSPEPAAIDVAINNAGLRP